jgi:hypothetical protein
MWRDGSSFDGAINLFRRRSDADAMDEVGRHKQIMFSAALFLEPLN